MGTMPLKRITAFGRKPTTAVQALTQAKALLEEEGHWCKGSLAKGIDKTNPDDPFCGSWKACAVGAVGLVTNGVRTTSDWVSGEPQMSGSVVNDACNLLDAAAKTTSGYGSIISLNDAGKTTRKTVIKAFDAAITLGKRISRAEQAAKRAARKKVLAEVMA